MAKFVLCLSRLSHMMNLGAHLRITLSTLTSTLRGPLFLTALGRDVFYHTTSLLTGLIAPFSTGVIVRFKIHPNPLPRQVIKQFINSCITATASCSPTESSSTSIPSKFTGIGVLITRIWPCLFPLSGTHCPVVKSASTARHWGLSHKDEHPSKA